MTLKHPRGPATRTHDLAEPQAEKLMAECFDKNMIDKDEYPQTADLEIRCVSIVSRVWHPPAADQATGCSTTGSSEAAMLGGLALKRRWQQRRRGEGNPTDRPNLVMGINVQVCWEKFANYWDVEMRLVPMEGDRFHLAAEEAVAQCDENTIGVGAVLGSTFDGSYEPVAEMCAALDDLQARTGLDVPVHVDDASGAFVAPFVDEDLEWDFRLDRAASINASGHNATGPSARIAELGPFELITHGDEFPVFAFKLRDGVDNFTVFDVSNAPRERGWLLPAYTFPKNREDLAALRVVVKRGCSHDMADLLVGDIERQLPRLQKQSEPVHDSASATSFHH